MHKTQFNLIFPRPSPYKLCLILYILYRTFSEAPHIAGSARQKKLAEDLVKRWREYGFDQVEMPEYRVLLSQPQKGKQNTASVLFRNGSVAFQTTGKAKVVYICVSFVVVCLISVCLFSCLM